MAGLKSIRRRQPIVAQETISPESLGLDMNALPESYRGLLQNIPAFHVEDTRSGIQKVLDKLGITNFIGNINANARMSAYDYYWQMLTTAREEKENDPLNVVSKERAAGLNPDLTGLSSGYQASEFNEPEQKFEYPDPMSGLSDMGSFVSSFIPAVQSAMGIVSAFRALQSQGLDLDSKRLQLALGSDVTSAPDLYKKILSMSDYLSVVHNNPDNVPVYGISDSFFNDLGIGKRSRALIRRGFDKYQRSLQHDIDAYDKLGKYNDSRHSYVSSSAEWYDQGNSNQDMMAVLAPWKSFLHEVEKAQAELAKSRAKFDKEYTELRNPEQSAMADNMQDVYEFDYYKEVSGETRGELENSMRIYQKAITDAKQKLLKDLLKSNNPIAIMTALQMSGDMDILGTLGDTFDMGLGLKKGLTPNPAPKLAPSGRSKVIQN